MTVEKWSPAFYATYRSSNAVYLDDEALLARGNYVWNPRLHPRGHDGQFIEIGGIIEFLTGKDKNKRGEVIGIIPDKKDKQNPKIRVKTDDGKTVEVKPGDIQKAPEKARLDTPEGRIEKFGPEVEEKRVEQDLENVTEADLIRMLETESSHDQAQSELMRRRTVRDNRPAIEQMTAPELEEEAGRLTQAGHTERSPQLQLVQQRSDLARAAPVPGGEAAQAPPRVPDDEYARLDSTYRDVTSNTDIDMLTDEQSQEFKQYQAARYTREADDEKLARFATDPGFPAHWRDAALAEQAYRRGALWDEGEAAMMPEPGGGTYEKFDTDEEAEAALQAKFDAGFSSDRFQLMRDPADGKAILIDESPPAVEQAELPFGEATVNLPDGTPLQQGDEVEVSGTPYVVHAFEPDPENPGGGLVELVDPDTDRSQGWYNADLLAKPGSGEVAPDAQAEAFRGGRPRTVGTRHRWRRTRRSRGTPGTSTSATK